MPAPRSTPRFYTDIRLKDQVIVSTPLDLAVNHNLTAKHLRAIYLIRLGYNYIVAYTVATGIPEKDAKFLFDILLDRWIIEPTQHQSEKPNEKKMYILTPLGEDLLSNALMIGWQGNRVLIKVPLKERRSKYIDYIRRAGEGASSEMLAVGEELKNEAKYVQTRKKPKLIRDPRKAKKKAAGKLPNENSTIADQ